MTGLTRHITIAVAVVATHVAGAWALNTGLRARTVEVLVPVHMLAELVQPLKDVAQVRATPVATVSEPAPIESGTTKAPTAKPTAKQTAKPAAKTVARTAVKAQPKPKAAPVPVRVALPTPLPTPLPLPLPLPLSVDPPPSATAPTATKLARLEQAAATVVIPVPVAGPAPVVAATPATASSVAAAPSPTARVALMVELPSSDAQYLRNPKPRYPPISNRLEEQGTVLIDVLVSDKGLAQDARIKASSGFYRLDDVALTTVLGWRFVPGKRAGVPESMWFTVPIRFGLQ